MKNDCSCGYPSQMMYRDMPTVHYLDSYDSYYCKLCDAWVSDECKCPAERCEFRGRPENPSDAIQ